MATVRSPLVHRFGVDAAPAVSLPTVLEYVELQPLGISRKFVRAAAEPMLVNVTVTVWFVPGKSGVAMPPNLLIVVQFDELDGLELEVQVTEPGPTSWRITAPAVATVLLVLPMTAVVHDEKVPFTPRTSSSAATLPAPQLTEILESPTMSPALGTRVVPKY